jgi:hypothetical protein
VAAIVIAAGVLASPEPSAIAQSLGMGMAAPELAGAPWHNSPPLTTAGLRGRVVLVEFWTYG